MYTYKEKIIRKGVARPGTKLLRFSGVTLHEEQGGSNEGALHYANLLYNICRSKTRLSSHYFVDDTTVVCSIPETETAVHANDFANRESIAITMCDYDGCDYEMLIENTAKLVADIFSRHKIKVVANSIFLHRNFSNFGRNCPKRFMAENRLASFAKTVQKILLGSNSCGCVDNSTRKTLFSNDALIEPHYSADAEPVFDFTQTEEIISTCDITTTQDESVSYDAKTFFENMDYYETTVEVENPRSCNDDNVEPEPVCNSCPCGEQSITVVEEPVCSTCSCTQNEPDTTTDTSPTTICGFPYSVDTNEVRLPVYVSTVPVPGMMPIIEPVTLSVETPLDEVLFLRTRGCTDTSPVTEPVVDLLPPTLPSSDSDTCTCENPPAEEPASRCRETVIKAVSTDCGCKTGTMPKRSAYTRDFFTK